MNDQPKKQAPNALLGSRPTGILVLQSGQVFYGQGCGVVGDAVGEVCFNTAMTGYQEILTDPSYSDQIVCFTFPHIGNTGTNKDDEEAACINATRAAHGVIMREAITPPASWRCETPLNQWLESRKIIGPVGH